MVFEAYKDEIAAVGSVVTILQFFTGLPVCFAIHKKGKAGDVSGFPFVAGCLGCVMWLTYGAMLKDSAMIYTNIVGCILQGLYVIVYYQYVFSKTVIQRQVMGSFVVLCSSLLYVEYIAPDPETANFTIGLVCCCMTILFCAAPLTQLSLVLKTKSTETLPFGIILGGFIVTSLWFCYGLAIHNLFLQVPNLTGAILAGLQLLLFVVFPSSHKYNVTLEKMGVVS